MIETEIAAAEAAATSEERVQSLLEAWRSCPHPVLADVIESYWDRPLPLSGASRKERLEAWAKLDRLDQIALITQDASIDSLWDRVRALTEDELPDPRVATRMIELVYDPPFVSPKAKDLWSTLFRALRAQQDPRTLDRLDQGWKDKVHRAFHYASWIFFHQELLFAAESAPPAPTLDDAVLERVEALRRVTVEDPETLLEAVRDNPDDLRWRGVYADALSMRGDARGEFVQLQLLPEPTAAQRRRAKALQKEHGLAWLGGLASVVRKSSAEYEQGFLRRCVVDPSNVATADRVSDDPAWWSVVDVRLPPRQREEHFALVAALPALRALHYVWRVDLLASHAPGIPLTTLGLRPPAWGTWYDLIPQHWPTVRCLELEEPAWARDRDNVRMQLEEDWAEQLERIVLVGMGDRGQYVRMWLELIEASCPVQQIEIRFAVDSYRVQSVRDDDWRFSELHVVPSNPRRRRDSLDSFVRSVRSSGGRHFVNLPE